MKTDKSNYTIVIDTRRCIGCNACTVACKFENSVPGDFYRSWVFQQDKGTYPQVSRAKIPHYCNQCLDAPCIPVCPVDATHRDAGGIITIDQETCVGCGECVDNCPYGARYLNPETEVADKCNMCFNRVTAGLLPACVSTCVAHALYFGDLSDPNSEVSQLLKEHDCQVLSPEYGTKPNVYYIGLKETMDQLDYEKHIKNGPFIATP
ncbi:tetrathionate reductase subunit B [Desulfuromusa kysingii]|uniref:Tetrathionate reductase subunit B n=1 Tax=Desulfuromusa kysingii TaxID=37625 RepID=A0A1H4ATW0_9BACT|nr:4Fe-4S dicluster domain-containing protein [Desulfuromusa kysingii]SEA39343.1 tetrathionate reductase subunit B [Desulfuromusa kysingii]